MRKLLICCMSNFVEGLEEVREGGGQLRPETKPSESPISNPKIALHKNLINRANTPPSREGVTALAADFFAGMPLVDCYQGVAGLYFSQFG